MGKTRFTLSSRRRPGPRLDGFFDREVVELLTGVSRLAITTGVVRFGKLPIALSPEVHATLLAMKAIKP
jgi:hypothetical protein